MSSRVDITYRNSSSGSINKRKQCSVYIHIYTMDSRDNGPGGWNSQNRKFSLTIRSQDVKPTRDCKSISFIVCEPL